MCSLVQTRRRICPEVENAYFMNLSDGGKRDVLWIIMNMERKLLMYRAKVIYDGCRLFIVRNVLGTTEGPSLVFQMKIK
jgi:hypothetical protein